MWRVYVFLLIALLWACGSVEKEETVENRNTLFNRLSAEETGIHFENTLLVQEDLDVFRYRNFYNGGGVGIGDFNNDGLPDVYLTSNMGENKLYLNKGNLKFEDITKKAGVAGAKTWATGVSIADVNGDGLLDIYVSNSGDVKGGNRGNELFINNGDLTFIDKAEEYGLADKGFTTHAAFFDYDKDGDLDCYILNNSFRPVSTLGYRNLRDQRDELGGHKLYRNDNGKFTDVSEQAGIYGSVIGFGLGVTVGDVNLDNWPDLYISNDFYERDYLYINQHDGTFSEELEKYMGHLSMFSMGADLADINNDGCPDIFSTDMLPEEDYRLKTLVAFETYDVYQLRLRNGYYHQFMRNMLQLNNSDGSFSEIGQLAGVSATDWSWGALISDFNNDAHKEIFVCNGIYKDLINQDFVEFLGSSENMRSAIEGKKVDFKEFVDKMPSQKMSNYMLVPTKDFEFKNESKAWGLDEPGFSNGAAYGDLDNDGDLDLIVNNVNQELFFFQNRADTLLKNTSLRLAFKGSDKNTFGLGAKVHAYLKGEMLYYENMPIRGFQSSMDYTMVIGTGNSASVDSLVVEWPDDKVEVLTNVSTNQKVVLDHAKAKTVKAKVSKPARALFSEVTGGDAVSHVENDFNEFDRDRLLYHMVSTEGPAFAKADLNNDHLDDFFLGGSAGHGGALYMQQSSGKFSKHQPELFLADSLADDIDAVFFDFDGDKDLDLYVVTGGSERASLGIPLLDRMYENKGMKNGRPEFVKTEKKMPAIYQAGSCVRPADIDHDGDLDLFVGTRMLPSYYGLPCDQFILLNDGKGNFTDATVTLAPDLKHSGMVTAAEWFDYDHDTFPDLMVIGDWMPITLYKNDGKKLTRVENIPGLEKTDGWWNSITASDLDGDGDTDFVLGNLGRNSKFKPTVDHPISLYVNDFDQNGSIEPIFTFMKDGEEYPTALRQDMIKQMSSLKKKFVYYRDYAQKSIADIFDPALLAKATKLNFYEPNTLVLINEGPKGFVRKTLPVEAQFSPVFAIDVADVNHDNKPDLVLGGNLFSVKPEVGRYDALHGLVLVGDGTGNFTPLKSQQSGIKLEGQVRHIARLKTKAGEVVAFVRNNDSIKFYKATK